MIDKNFSYDVLNKTLHLTKKQQGFLYTAMFQYCAGESPLILTDPAARVWEVIKKQIDDAASAAPIRSARRTPTAKKSAGVLSAEQQNFFNEFWELYPRKVEKIKTVAEWVKLNPDEALFKKIICGIKNAIDKQYKYKIDTEDEKFIPYPNNWIKNRKWEDEYKEYKPTPQDSGEEFIYAK